MTIVQILIQTDVKSAKRVIIAQKQSRKTVSAAKTARKTLIKKKARKTLIERKKASKKYKIKWKNKKATFDDKLNQYFIYWTSINKKI